MKKGINKGIISFFSIFLLVFVSLNVPVYGTALDSNTKTAILAAPSAVVGQAKNWARLHGATDTFISLADIYWKIAPTSGIDPAAAYAQSAKETNFGKFTGVLNESFHNPCGLKTRSGGGDYEKDAHKIFSSWEEGIQAHVDHLALYAGAPGYPKSSTPDSRHFSSLKGKAVTVEALGGKWAGSPSYGTDIVQMMNELKSQNASYPPPDTKNSDTTNRLATNFVWILGFQNPVNQYRIINKVMLGSKLLHITDVQ